MQIKPAINVTPLIDVLLVLLIVFMVITPLKPTDFKAQIPREPNNETKVRPLDDTLVVSLNADFTLKLNTKNGFGTVSDPKDLISGLMKVFAQRTKNGAYSERLLSRTDLPNDQKIERTVFIKAPRSIDYGSVAKVIDAVRISGAEPISLQIDDLN